MCAIGELPKACLGGVRAEASQFAGFRTAVGLVLVSAPIAPAEAFTREPLGKGGHVGNIACGHVPSARGG